MTAAGAAPRCAILAVGSELLTPLFTDTNSLWLTAELEALGVLVDRKVVVGDDVAAIAEEVQRLAADHELVIISGGLGPTDDDVTREAVARAAGKPLQLDLEQVALLEERFARRGWHMPAINTRQAMVVEGSTVVPNPRGSAPGALVEIGGCAVMLLPGVPIELHEMAEQSLFPLVRARFAAAAPQMRRIVRCCGLPESAAEERLRPVYAAHPEARFTILAGRGQIELHAVMPVSGSDAAARLDAIEAELRAALGDAVFGRGSETLAETTGALLAGRGETLAVAESCTGGGLGEEITRVAGSSGWFLGGIVAYSNDAKCALLGVDRELVAAHGAVSPEVALAMARGARERFGATHALAVTGVAGPGGGTAEKPVGMVVIAHAGPGGENAKTLHLYGDRSLVRSQSVLQALDLLRRGLFRAAVR